VTSEQHRWVLTGGLASGKSTVRRFLEAAGIVTIDSDAVGHAVLRSDGPAFAHVATRWPQVVEDGEIDRARLGRVVFNDPEELSELEAMTHPHIFGMIRARVEEIDSPVVVEIPLAGHRLGTEWMRIVVDCRDEIRLRRAIGRGLAEIDAKTRLAAQPTRAEWLATADLVIPNHGSRSALESTVDRIVRLL
jgi:dephospho-CoA kinase